MHHYLYIKWDYDSELITCKNSSTTALDHNLFTIPKTDLSPEYPVNRMQYILRDSQKILQHGAARLEPFWSREQFAHILGMNTQLYINLSRTEAGSSTGTALVNGSLVCVDGISGSGWLVLNTWFSCIQVQATKQESVSSY